ncbi:MAG: aminoacyl-histidine dipeptidase [Calditrichaceae bacterium]
MKEVIAGLEPGLVWEHFYQISQIPRCSGNEEAVGQYLIEVAKKKNLPWKKDSVGNIIISKPASKGMEKRPGVVIQGHIDMVCEKNNDTVHDFSKDPIRFVRDGEWMKADGTTLGADNGIGVAMALAVMDDNTLTHPPMEFLFTVDEETGLTGANELKNDFVNGRILLNLDSEEEGALYIGCAGGQHTILKRNIDWQSPKADGTAYRVKVSGLRGGHSGLNISEDFGNAIKLLARLLYQAGLSVDFQLASINGGNKHNAIPREADAVIVLSGSTLDTMKKLVTEYDAIYKEELKFVDKDVKVTIEKCDAVKNVFNNDLKDQLVKMIYAMPHGVMTMSHAVAGLVETSTNMAIVETKKDNVELLTSQRSSVASAVADIADKIKALGELSGFKVEQGGGYPAWAPNPDSELLKVCKSIYANKYKSEPDVKAIHAGLECGIIGEHYDGMDMISFGPDIEGAHSPDERVKVSSVAHTWDYLLEVLREIK